MIQPYRHSAFAAAIATLLLVAGCGDSNSEASKTAFVEEANRICKKAFDQRSKAVGETAEAIAKESQRLSPAQEQTRITLEAVVPVEKRMVEALADLPVPDGDEEQIEAMLKSYEDGIAAYEADPRSAFEAPTSDANHLAKAYGLSEELCSI